MSRVDEEILRRAKAFGLKITCAESCTGGMISAALTDIAGSSAIFEQGFVTYSNGAKQKMLGVSHKTLADYGAVSEAVAREMAEGALRQAQADLAISVSGIAGPGLFCPGLRARHSERNPGVWRLGPPCCSPSSFRSCLKLNPCASQFSPLIEPGA